MRKIIIAIVIVICLLCACFLPACSSKYSYKPLPASVRYLTNTQGDVVTLSSGREAISESIVFYSQDVKTGDILTPPTEQPTQSGYNFVGWAVDKEGTALYDFTKPVEGSLNLYAKWERKADTAETDLDYTEPTLSFTEVIDNATPFALTAICNKEIAGNSVDLTTAGIRRLTAKANDVKELLTYTRASDTLVNSAVYADNKVTVSYTAGGSSSQISITVNDVTATMAFTDDASSKGIDESTFETKARKYEAKDFENNASYQVIMGGSSSMENWSTSVEDMSPMTTMNVGIGGSSSVHWRTLSDRLILPYNPRAVVLYLGINDIINYNQTGKKTAENLIWLFEHIYNGCQSKPTIHFILINHVPGYYTRYKDYIDTANNEIIKYAETHTFVNIIDAGVVLEKKSGVYSEAYFLKDGLHMSIAGYELWGAEVKNAVIKKEKELYDK